MKVGLALSDAGFYRPGQSMMPKDLDFYFRLAEKRLPGQEPFFEFQPEASWILEEPGHFFAPDKKNKWLELGRAMRRNDLQGPYAPVLSYMSRQGSRFGVHQSIRDMDILSEDISVQLRTLESAKQGMLFAGQIRAEYFVFHLAQSVDYWDWDRREQMDVAVRAFQEMADFYHQCAPGFIPLLENLEFPKFPATAAEIVNLFKRCREFLPGLGLCLDVPHLWHSRALILENRKKLSREVSDLSLLKGDFLPYLEHTLSHIAAQCGAGVYLYHMGGCYEHETHEIPGLLPGEDPFRHHLRLDETDIYDPELELDYPGAINTILRHHLREVRELLMVLEIHNRSFEEMLEVSRQITRDLHDKAARLITL